MPAFLFLVFVSVLGWINVGLLFALDKPLGAVLVGLLALQISHLAHAFRPERPRAGVVTPDYPVMPDLLALNSDFWALGYQDGLVVKAFADALAPVEFYTLGSSPIWAVKCAVRYCEHTARQVCFCAEDCDCAFHSALRDEEFLVVVGGAL